MAPMRWRFLTRPMDLPTRPVGSYVRITVGGRDVPTYAVRRSPTGNWGFLMESCWGLFASFPLPERRQPRPETPPSPPVPAAGRITRHGSNSSSGGGTALRRRLRRDPDGTARWVWASENDDDDDRRRQRTDPDDLLRDDAHLLITNEVQWREAFLYNVGARVLPEGEEATDDFDRAWGGLGVE